MKIIKLGWILCIALSVSCIALSFVVVGCKTADPNTGERVYDPAKTEQVKAAVKPAIAEVLRQILVNSPEHATNSIAPYFRRVGGVFCLMVAEKKFSPAFLTEQLRLIEVPQLGDNNIVPILKNTIIALYEGFYAQRHSAELKEDAWVLHVADLFCKAIDTGLTDAGYPGIPAP